MQISPIRFLNFNFQKTKFEQNNIKLKTITQDTVSFSGTPKKDYNEEMKKLPKECFPSNDLREYMLSQLDNPSNKKNVLELHKEYYSKLSDCKSIDEARKLYPEFNGIVDAKDIDINTLNTSSALYKITKGKVEGIKIEDLSLELLKNYYANFTSIRLSDEYFGLSGNVVSRLLSDLNIRMDDKYYLLLQNLVRSINAKANWQNPACVEKHIKARQNPEYRKHQSELTKKSWENSDYSTAQLSRRQNPEFIKRHKEACSTDEFRAKASKNKTAFWQNPDSRAAFRTPEARARRSQISKNLWQTFDYQDKLKEAHNSPSYKAKRLIISYALKVAWEEHPYGKEVCSEIAKYYPRLGTLLTKMENGIPLTSEEKCYYLSYCSAIDKQYPELKKEVGTIQKELLQLWGYKKGMKPEALFELIDKIKSEYEILDE